MKLARIALTAVLALPGAAQAEIIKNPGPFTVPKTQFACQNLLDYQDLNSHEILGKRDVFAAKMARHNTDEQEAKGFRCMTIQKGTKVRVKDRWIARECVEIVGRPSTACFYMDNVSGQRRPDTGIWGSFYAE